MKKEKQTINAQLAHYAPSGSFALRTPLLPVDELRAWSAGLQLPAATDDRAIEAALASDRALLRRRLRALVDRPEVREALFVASPSLDDSLAHWHADPDGERGLKVERALVRYLQRMALRATPFGLFAGCSVGAIGEVTRLELAPRTAWRRHTRLDVDYLFALTEALVRDPALAGWLRVRPNSSLYRAAGKLRYAEARLGGDGGRSRSYHLAAVEPSDYLERTLARAASGERSIDELAAALCDDDPEVSLDEARGFLAELVAEQVLAPELAPTVTGHEPGRQLVADLAGAPRLSSGIAAAEVLAGAQRALASLDEDGLGLAPARYHAIAQGLGPLPLAPSLPRLFQVDLVKPAPVATLGHDVTRALVAAVETLRAIAPLRRRPIDRFRDAFVARFEEREVPLVDALDDEIGVGFDGPAAHESDASPLLDGLDLSPAAPEPERFGERSAHLLRRVDEVLRARHDELALDDEDLAALARPDPPPPLPDCFAVLATLLARTPDEAARGEGRILLEAAFGPSGATLLGRFCHADPRLDEAVRRLLAAEEALRPDAIFAEVVHLPEGRAGNVLARPVLRGHEIPYLGRSGAPRDRQIPVEDLLVSVRAGRVRLRSRRLDREVLPRLTNAHNYDARSLGVYRFLGHLQQERVAGNLAWSWGPLAGAARLPRVVRRRVVLEPARWNLTRRQLAPVAAAHGVARVRALARLRADLGLPRHVALPDADHLLPVDLDNVLSVETFLQLVRERVIVALVELPAADGTCAFGPDGGYAHELVVPFVRIQEETAQSKRSAVSSTTEEPKDRALLPGSEWLFLKLYCGPTLVDELLRALVAPLLDEARAAGLCDRWFFLRFADPDWHLRLRLHGDGRRLCGELLPRLHELAAPLVADGRLLRIAVDTYALEVERYGGARGLALAERLFCVDSDAALAILATLDGAGAEDARWRLALRSVHDLLVALGLDGEARRRVTAAAREGLGREHRVDTRLARQLGDRYRRERASLEALLAARPDDDAHPLAPGLAILGRRTAALAPIVDELRAAERAGALAVPLETLASSYAHMSANRLLRAAARAQELVIHDLLARLYEGEAARAARR